MPSLLDMATDPDWQATSLLAPPDGRPPALQPDPQADAVAQTWRAASDQMAAAQAESERQGLWTGGGIAEGGHPTQAALLDGIRQAAMAVALGTGGGEGKGFTAYHGSPHAFDAFSNDAIGSGEGNQAYGYGHYLAEAEAVARGYRDKLTTDNLNYIDSDGTRTPYGDLLQRAYGAVRQVPGGTPDIWRAIPRQVMGAIEDGTSPEQFMSDYDVDPKYASHYQAAVDALAGVTHSPNKGSMYEVNVNADPDHFLDWDSPLSEQSPHVRESLLRMDKVGAAPEAWDETGRDWYRGYSGDIEGAADLSTAMRDAGIPGVRYLDGNSRYMNDATVKALGPDSFGNSHWQVGGGGAAKWFTSEDEANAYAAGLPKPTRNAVVFDPGIMEIIRRYGLAGLIAGGAGAGAANQGRQ